MPLRIQRYLPYATVLCCLAATVAYAQAPAAQPLHLAVVDMDRVMSESEMGKAEQANIDKLRQDRSEIIDNKQKELSDLEETIRNASLSWSDERREARMHEYETKRIEVQRLNEDATRDVQNAFNSSLAKLQKAALAVTGIIGKEQGYTMIFEKKTLPVLFASDSIDVTDEVLRRLNDKWNAAKAPAAPATPGGSR
ncbi:MAG TPA: OmpH family outer membrane protein [Candidatus Saccharimonadales bacterium]|nr:OmpH family outer membrane protein [Candidatus Saccharimonadales bacterium]